MVKNKKVKFNVYIGIIILAALSFFFVFLVNSELLTSKDNDLGRTYVPILSFVQDSLLIDKSIPLWRPEQMMGEPFIGNALFPVIYPFNLILLFMSVNLAVVIFYLVHFVIAGVSTYYLARSFFLKNISSLAAALFYAFSVKMMVQTSAGHITMVAAFSFFPLAFLSIRKLLQNPKIIWILSGAISLAFLIILYPTIFYYSSIFLIVYSIYYIWTHSSRLDNSSNNSILAVIATFIIGFGLSAIQLIPLLEFGSLSTRSQLRLEDVAIPLWNIKEFMTSLIFPYPNLSTINHEAFLYLGIVPSILAVLGFLYISKLRKIIIISIGILTLLFVAGLSSPIFPVAYDYLPFLKYSRVTTRLWFIVALLVALLAAYGLDRIKNKTIIYTLIAIFLVESFFIGYYKILNIPDLSFSNRDLYEFIANDDENFRVYCTTYCFNPQLVSTYNIQVLHGETPIQDEEFIKYLQNAGGYEFVDFAVIFPPYQTWQNNNKPMPKAQLLGAANVKYIASSYMLNNDKFVYINKFNELYLYRNSLLQPRAILKNSQSEVKIEQYSPNKIILSFEKTKNPTDLLLSEKFYPGWIVSMGQQKLKVYAYDSIFRAIEVPAQVSRVELNYKPESFNLGKNITIGTILFLLLYFWHTRKQKLNG